VQEAGGSNPPSPTKKTQADFLGEKRLPVIPDLSLVTAGTRAGDLATAS
jgi:hypothetical protein